MVDQSMRDREIPVDTIGYAGRCANTSPPVTHDDNSNHRWLNWEYQGAGANRLCAFRFALRTRVCESLWWRSLSFESLGIVSIMRIMASRRRLISLLSLLGFACWLCWWTA